MVQEPFQLHLPDQLSLGKCALGWKGARERRGERPGTQNFFIFYVPHPHPLPEDGGLLGVWTANRSLPCEQCVSLLGSKASPVSDSFVSPLPAPLGHPSVAHLCQAAVCVCQCWAGIQPAGDCQTQRGSLPDSHVAGDAGRVSHSPERKLLAKLGLCPPSALEALSGSAQRWRDPATRVGDPVKSTRVEDSH